VNYLAFRDEEHELAVRGLLKAIKVAKMSKEKLEYRLALALERIQFLERDMCGAAKTVDEFDDEIEFLKAVQSMSAEMKAFKAKPKIVASKGGKARAGKYEPLKIETIRLYIESQAKWSNMEQAALDLRPLIIDFARKYGHAEITQTSKKPREWISEYKKQKGE
jgi:hypothetical protein